MTWMELECIMLTEIKSIREGQIPYDFTHIGSELTKQMNIYKGERGERERNHKRLLTIDRWRKVGGRWAR